MDTTGAPQGASSFSAAAGNGVEVAVEAGSKENSDHVITGLGKHV